MKKKILKLACLSLVTMGLSVAVSTAKADDLPSAPAAPFNGMPFLFHQGLVKNFVLTDNQLQDLKSKGQVTTKFVGLVPYQKATNVTISILARRDSFKNAFIYFDSSLLSALENGEKVPVVFTDYRSDTTRTIYLKKATNFVAPSDDVVPSLN
ncbi:hypothetical protein [Streptococcus sobrinus]|uniref:hypothetical protein n=1 Tax=Streptococcus sobrinus TaxID=1310 RepID=UPI0002F190C8|nr:hypothetical protein [Streptococcus sobrinus]